MLIMRCHEVYQNGCRRRIRRPSWFHPGEWRDGDGRPTEPRIRDDIPEDLLRKLARSTEAYVRRAVLRHPATPPDVIDSFVGDPNESVHKRAIGRTGTAELLRRAVQDSRAPGARFGEHAWTVRSYVAINPRSPVDLLEELGQDPRSEVRELVMANPSTPQRLRDAHASDPDERVRYWATRR